MYIAVCTFFNVLRSVAIIHVSNNFGVTIKIVNYMFVIIFLPFILTVCILYSEIVCNCCTLSQSSNLSIRSSIISQSNNY